MAGHREKGTRKGRILQILAGAASLITVLVVAFTAAANSGQAAAKAMAGLPGIGRLVRVVTFRSYRDQLPSGHAEADIDTLMVHGLADEALQQQINAALADWSDKMIERYHSDLEEIGVGGREAVDCRKRERLRSAAESYLALHDLGDAPARFDVAEVYTDGNHRPVRLEYLEDAFQ